MGLKDIWLNLSFTTAAFLLLLTVPVTGYLLDKYWRRITGLRITTFIASFLYLVCTYFVIAERPFTALIFFALALYSYLLTFTFYTPLLNDIALPERRGKVSGMGIAANYTGQLTGLLVVLPFSNGLVSWFGSTPRAETLLPAVIIFTLLTLPMVIFFKEPKRPQIKIIFRNEIRELFSKTKSLFLYSGVGLFMLTYFFSNDALLTASNNFPIFMEQVWGVSDNVKTYILAGILITSAIGGWISGIIADRFGHKKTFVVITTGWLIILPLIAYATNFALFVTMTTLMGLWFGANWAVSRSVMSYLAPPGQHNIAFGYFGLVERASSFIGPVVWGLVVSNLISMGPDRYRLATIAVTGFIILGLVALRKVRSDRVSAGVSAHQSE